MASLPPALLLLVALSIGSVSACPDGFEPWIGGYCFKFYSIGTKYDLSQSLCELSGGELTSIHSADEQAKIIALANSRDVWIGLRCKDDNSGFYWTDGSPVDWVQPIGNGPCTADQHFILKSDGKWYANAATSSFSAVCKHKRRNSPSCEDFDETSGSGTCVSLKTTAASWNDAEKQCARQNAHLVSIHDKATNDAIAQRAVAAGVRDGLHIGMMSNASDLSLRWSDGSKIDYKNYGQGFPFDRFGHCTTMETTEATGQWISNQCATSSLPYACGRLGYDLNHPLAPAGCPTNRYYLVGSTLFSPSYPATSGKIECEYFLVAPEGKNAQIVFDDFQTNKCCDKLQVFDSPLGENLLQTFTGQLAAGTSYRIPAGTIRRLIYTVSDGAQVRGWTARLVNE